VKKQAFEALLKHPNVMMTPHVAGWTQESWSQLSEVLADKILAS
jgi:D-3-phosphoglycerate dehydrogenase